jgi:hypothetical protein
MSRPGFEPRPPAWEASTLEKSHLDSLSAGYSEPLLSRHLLTTFGPLQYQSSFDCHFLEIWEGRGRSQIYAGEKARSSINHSISTKYHKHYHSHRCMSKSQVGPYRKCCHVQTRAPGHVLLVSLNVGIYHRRIYLIFTDQVHCMYRPSFQPIHSFFAAFNFPLEICLILHSFQ